MGWNSIKARRRDIYQTIINFLNEEARNLKKGESAFAATHDKKMEIKGDLNQAADLISSAKAKYKSAYNDNAWEEERIRLG